MNLSLLKDRNKLFILMLIPSLIIATIIFIIEFMLAPHDPPYVSLVGFGILIAFGTFIYFKNTTKVKETKEKKEALKGYLLYVIPSIVISVILFLIFPPSPPYLLVYGLIIFLVAYTVVFYLAIKAVKE